MVADLAQQLVAASRTSRSKVILEPFSLGGPYENELLFFFKPETFVETDQAGTEAIIQLCREKFAEFDLQLAGAMYIAGGELARLQIMDRHYGYINRISRAASSEVTREERVRIAAALDLQNMDRFTLLGGHEALERYMQLDAASLNQLWATKKSVRLRSGFYVQAYEMFGDRVILINGFHPSQLEHFTAEGHGIGVLLLQSNTNWRRLRADFAGDTFPERANPSSVRAELLRKRELFRLGTISVATNYIHLSAGPFEGAFEIANFLGAAEVPGFNRNTMRVAQALSVVGLPESALEDALRNPQPIRDDKLADLFTATEDTDTLEAVRTFREHYYSTGEL